MSTQLRHRLVLGVWIVLACLFSVGLVVYRMAATGVPSFKFLLWNLVLAVVPLVFSSLALLVSRSRWKWVSLLFLVPWLLFFPNAPYILTDLMHLRPRAAMPFWYDLVMLLSFALNGLFLGFVSLRMVEAALERDFDRTTALLASLVFAFLAAYGIYLGRFHRLNSWEVWTGPEAIAGRVLGPVFDPFAHPRAWAVTLILGFILYAGYRVVQGMGGVLGPGERGTEQA